MPLVDQNRLARMEATLKVSPIAAKASRDLVETVRMLRRALGIATTAWAEHAQWDEGDEDDEHTEWWFCRSVFDETGPPDV